MVLFRASLKARRTSFSAETNGSVCSYAPSGASLDSLRTQGSASLHPGLRSCAVSRLKCSGLEGSKPKVSKSTVLQLARFSHRVLRPSGGEKCGLSFVSIDIRPGRGPRGTRCLLSIRRKRTSPNSTTRGRAAINVYVLLSIYPDFSIPAELCHQNPLRLSVEGRSRACGPHGPFPQPANTFHVWWFCGRCFYGSASGSIGIVIPSWL